MTVTTAVYGYLERPYLEEEYLVAGANASAGMQALFVIEDDKAVGMQTTFSIVDYLDPIGMQATFSIVDFTNAVGMQSQFVIEDDKAIGMQVLANIVDFTKAVGMQSLFNTVDFLKPIGMQVRFDKALSHTVCGYLDTDYLEDAYLAGCYLVNIGMQVNFVIEEETSIGTQAQFVIEDDKAVGMQTVFSIVDYLKAIGMQVDTVKATNIGMQVTVALYNTTNIRFLCEFPSRGAKTGVGNNSWGNPIATGKNWKSNSTQAGDFSPFNLNTDIVEQYWRSATGVITGVNIDCDTEIAQGVFLDTFAMLGHNLTKSATVNLLGSDFSNFSTIAVTIPLEQAEENTYFIAPTLPNTGYRYWRLSIDDSTNPDGFLSIGTILFGAGQIFQGECFVDEIEITLRDFADTVKTEGFTNVANSRAQKRLLKLEFRFLDLLKGNYTILRDMFKNERTVLKCLYIPTPDENNDQDKIGRYAVFGKLTQIPTERHSNRGAASDWASFTLEVDESF